MCLFGKVEKFKIKVLFPFLLIILQALALSARAYEKQSPFILDEVSNGSKEKVSKDSKSDFAQIIIGDPVSSKEPKLVKDAAEKQSPFVTDEVLEKSDDDVSKQKLNEDPYIFQESGSKEDPLNAKITTKDKLLQFGQEIVIDREEPAHYTSASNREIFKQASNQGKRSFGISYLKDMSSYSGKNNAFNDTYSGTDEVVKVGLLSLSFKKFLKKGGVNFAYRINGSVGLNQAPALFASKTSRSEKNISLWIVPVDFAFDMEMALGEKFKLELQGGPSVCGIFQNRHDKKEGEEQKRLGQVGFGFVAGIGLKTNLMQFKSTSSIDLLSSLSASDYYFDISARYHSYAAFLEDITVSGIAIGAGISYDFL